MTTGKLLDATTFPGPESTTTCKSKRYQRTTLSVLKRNLTSEFLDRQVYGDADYYWYLRSEPFVETFLKPLAERVNCLGLNCLDVACGEGQLAKFVQVPYKGFDASPAAIAAARRDNPQLSEDSFCVGRLEDFDDGEKYGTVILSNVLWPLIRQEQYGVAAKQLVERFNAKYLAVCDLAPLCETDLEFLRLENRYSASVVMTGIPKIKKHRKILIYSCKR